MDTVTFLQFQSALIKKGIDAENLLALSKSVGIPQPTLWRWKERGIPANKRSQDAVRRVVEELNLDLTAIE